MVLTNPGDPSPSEIAQGSADAQRLRERHQHFEQAHARLATTAIRLAIGVLGTTLTVTSLAWWAADAPMASRGWLIGWALAAMGTIGVLVRTPPRGGRDLPLAALLAPLAVLALAPTLAGPGMEHALTLLVTVSCALLALAWAVVQPQAWLAALLQPAIALAWLLPSQPRPSQRIAWTLALLAAGALASWATRLRSQHWNVATSAMIDARLDARALAVELDAERRRSQDKSRFVATASHDLRQPLHALALFAATLERRLEGSLEEPLARHLMRSIDHAERSFTALFDISKLDAGTLQPQIERFALRDVFRRLQMHFGGQAGLAGLALRFAPGGRWVASDPQLLERILANLVQNALKHTTRGGVLVIARHAGAGLVRIEVCDTGCGIAARQLTEIFREYYQVEAAREHREGLGLGLAIVHRLARLLGHGLDIVSEPGRGTRVRLTVPAADASQLDGIDSGLDTRPQPIETDRVVLVIDDDAPIREGLRMLLQDWGLHAVVAASARQAEQIAIALEGRIDLVLTDLNLGEGPDGLQALRSLRRLLQRDVPAIVITGDLAHAHVAELARSADPVLLKPVRPGRLYEAIRASLSQ